MFLVTDKDIDYFWLVVAYLFSKIDNQFLHKAFGRLQCYGKGTIRLAYAWVKDYIQ